MTPTGTLPEGAEYVPCLPCVTFPDDAPIRAELCGAEQLDRMARDLAARAALGRGSSGARLPRRLRRNERILRTAYRDLTSAGPAAGPLTPDAEWLVDNFYLIEEVLGEVRTHLPRGYSAELPVLAQGPLAGLPRSYELAVALLAHTDSALDGAGVRRFVRAYQEVSPLKIGELWAVPTMLRLALLENLGRLARRVLKASDDRLAGEVWALSPAEEERAINALEVRGDAFIVGILHAVGDRGPTSAEAAARLQDWLGRHDLTAAEVLRRAHREQAANQVSIGNCVTSLRLLGVIDWTNFFEALSTAEQVLRSDPAGAYPRQEFSARDACRRAVEQLARGSRHNEVEVAQRAVDRAGQAAHGRNPRAGHVGFHLIDAGREAFERELQYRPPLRDWPRRLVLRHPGAFYFGSIAALTALLCGLAAWVSGELWVGIIAILAVLLPASEAAVAVVNYLVCRLLPPRMICKLDFKDGIPEDCTAFIVMPALLTRPGSAAGLLERLELHYLANPDPRLRFALLTDFTDAPAEHMPDDAACLRAALDGVRALNAKYRNGNDGEDRFFLFHRRRQWNPSEGCWMGLERKRGKLLEFNRQLRGDRGSSFTVCSGDVEALPHIRYVITLDADTVLPRDAARRLIATLAHPLNQPLLSADRRRVVAGHAVVQPRVSFLPQAGRRSVFAHFFAGSAGVDPYSSAVSDVYEDLFDRGSYTGKGAYDVDAFEAVTASAFPENHILSHDLIEGNFARCGLVTDVEVFDDFPARYHTFARRQHRWARGDWQLLPWLGPTVPVANPGHAPGRAPNVLPVLERWKVLDNLRRTLLPPALLVLLVLGWTILPGPAWGWTLAALAVLAAPLLLLVLDTALALLTWSPLRLWRQIDMSNTVGQVVLSAVFLPHQAGLMLDAIVRTLVRLYLTRRRLLEWETAAAAEQRLGDDLTPFLAMMWPASLFAAGLAVLLVLGFPGSFPTAAPLLALWALSPVIGWIVSQPTPSRKITLSAADRRELRRLARKTWSFFEQFVGPEDHWLPPDNFQEDPRGVVAHRTSPTNTGLMLLSNLAAHDLGYLTIGELTDRLRNTFETLDRLERHRGHFLNWYDTRTLQPLPPAYVSTVDSGNLLGCLLTLARGLRQKLREPVPAATVRDGLQDVFAPSGEEDRDDPQLPPGPADLPGWHDWLGEAPRHGNALAAEAVHKRKQELEAVCPWVGLLRDALAAGAALPAESRLVWKELCSRLTAPAGVADWVERLPALQRELGDWLERFPDEASRSAAARLAESLGQSEASKLTIALQTLADRAEVLAAAMDFRFLYNAERHLFAIGYNRQADRLDAAHYDLLASEACLTSFLCVARGEVPRQHWFQLGRLFTRVAGMDGLLSWGGTMFEYLMPRLLLADMPGSLLDTAHRAAVARQIQYGRETGVPWGVSESAYNLLDATRDYQYQSFGVPGLGLKRGLNQDLVVAPYASALALAIDPTAVAANFRRLRSEGAEGQYGFCEAIDYTSRRLAPNQRHQVIRSYMAHHQGMTLVALANCLLGDVMPARLGSVPIVRAAELLLQERPPAEAPVLQPHTADETVPPAEAAAATAVSRRLRTADTPSPRVHLLSNGTCSVLVTNAGSGFSRCRGLDVTRWQADRTTDAWGQFCYVRDVESNVFWSAAHHPVGRATRLYEAIFSVDKVEFRRLDDRIETRMEIVVAPDKDVEVRRVTLTNHDTRPRDLELTSYAEVVLLPHAADLAHPAFGKLFLETEWLPEPSALLCRRRARSEKEKPIWAVHVLAVSGAAGRVSCETDRARFVGRRRTPARPAALDSSVRALSGTTGAVLDPVLSLRWRARLAPGSSVTAAFTTGVGESREEAVALADQYHAPQTVTRAFELAWAHSRVELNHLNLSVENSHRYQRLLGHLLFPDQLLRAPASVLAANRQGQAGLWRHGISGDLPILLVRVSTADDLPLVREALAAHAFWRGRGLACDAVLLNEAPTSYFEDLHNQLKLMAQAPDGGTLADRPGGVFVRKADQMSADDRVLLQAAAAVVLSGERGSLEDHLHGLEREAVPARLPAQVASNGRPARSERRTSRHGRREELLFANGFGGFRPEGREYQVGPATPPAPWINVVAWPEFGFLVTDSGGGYTWAGNSQANRLTPWCNDPVSDSPGEVIYLRDDETGTVWTPTPLPAGRAATTVRHGQGYSVFEQFRPDLDEELAVFAAVDAPVKVYRLRLRNRGAVARRLRVSFYVEWVLGTTRERESPYVVTSFDAQSGAVLARNPFNADLPDRIAFAASIPRADSVTGDRTEFLGRNRRAEAPAALERVGLSGRTGAGLDPCAALQVKVDLGPYEQREVVFLLGEVADANEVRTITSRFREPADVEAALRAVTSRWDEVLSAVRVQTPDPALDLLLNRWLLYQVLSCRFWGRSAFYQSGGAYGYRDQLQDVLALVYAAPALTREHLLRVAAHQFVEGDVQHWWHPTAGGLQGGRGIRTRFSDDFLWLPFAVCRYLEATGDEAVLDEPAPFLTGPPLDPGQDEAYFLPVVSSTSAPLYEHCIRALEHGWKLGAHGLPLMGCGDWNDGMNRVGAGGRGESVWVAWFQIVCWSRFAEVAERRGDTERAAICRDRAEQLRAAVEMHGWDGAWYRRAYFDDGTPLGTASGEECRIDSIAQSWSVLSGAAESHRTVQAMASAVEHLVKWDDRLILLLTPPFGSGHLQPGYIKGYVPGVRENGGQYTHAAIWLVQAMAALGRGGEAHRLFELLNPIHHGETPERVARYRVEPYVVAADVYSVQPHIGRGGWTWYTGSAAWLYRLGLESILGFHRRGDRLTIDPRVPASWPSFAIDYRHGKTLYRIRVENSGSVERGVRRVSLDGKELPASEVPLTDDGREHQVLVEMG